jgi:hypothetical protein
MTRNDKGIYNGQCRFTERALEVKRHGSGLKLTIHGAIATVRTDGSCSIFLDNDSAIDLAANLGNWAGDPAPVPGQQRLDRLMTTLHTALREYFTE